jgi:hypothetical protein
MQQQFERLAAAWAFWSVTGKAGKYPTVELMLHSIAQFTRFSSPSRIKKRC